jgi:hypothetical protein
MGFLRQPLFTNKKINSHCNKLYTAIAAAADAFMSHDQSGLVMMQTRLVFTNQPG